MLALSEGRLGGTALILLCDVQGADSLCAQDGGLAGGGCGLGSGNAAQVKSRLASYQPLLMDALPLSLEEIFIYELGGADHEMQNIIL